MEVHFSPDVQAKLDRLVTESGCSADEFIQDAIAIYFDELTEVRATLDSRYDDLESGKVTPIDGEAFFEQLRVREEELLRKPSAR